MQKKVFLQRNLRKSRGRGGPHLKYLVISAVCLVLLVAIVPYLLKGKNKEVTKRPVPERGAITKELPKPTEPTAPAMMPGQVGPGETPVNEPETRSPESVVAPEAIKAPEVQPPSKPPALPPAGNALAPAIVPPAPVAVQTAKPAEPAPKDLFPKKSTPFESPPAAVKKAPGKPHSKASAQAPAAKPAPAAAKGNYAVQVGSAFKDRSEAETVRKDLARKGYSAMVRTVPGDCGYNVITSPSPESKAYTLQEQMKIQGLSNTTIIKVSPVSGPAQKPLLKKPADGKAGGSSDPSRW